MSDVMQIAATETGVVRVFALDGATSVDLEHVSAALGDIVLDPAHVDLITLADLEDLGLHGYLRDGMGIPEGELAPMRMQLEALSGDVAVIRSAAFSGQAVTLRPKAPLRWIASFGERPLDLAADPLTSRAAQGTLNGSAPAQPVSHTKTLLWVLAALAFFVITTISMLIRITA